MWETPPPDTAGNAVGDGQEVVTPAAIEAVLADFRSWLQQLSGTAPAVQPPEEETEAIDLHTLLGQFVALRHDVHLQTKAARSQQELTGQALQQVSQALDALRQTQAAAQQANRGAQAEAVRPLLKTLLDVHDAFSLAEREIRRARETVEPLLDQLAFETPPSDDAAPDWEADPVTESGLPLEPDPGMEAESEPASTPVPRPRPSWWQRWFGGRGEVPPAQPEALARLQSQRQRLLVKLEEQQQVIAAQRERRRQEVAAQRERQEKIRQASQRLHQLIDSVVTGYRMSLQRLERALEHSGLEPIACVGQPFDPEQMEVVAAVVDSGRPVGEVIEEVRRGYRWRGRVFRYAQVSVAKS